jgi:hypothetical protein
MAERERPRQVLERELYWAAGDDAASLTPTAELRARLQELAGTLHRQAGQAAPWGDPLLSTGSRWKRRFKIGMFRLLRPISRRYDRVTAELAATSLMLADRLARLEEDRRRQEEELARLSRALRRSIADREDRREASV